LKASAINISRIKARDAGGIVLSKTNQGFKQKKEHYSREPILPVDSINSVDDDRLFLDLFNGEGYDRALVELNLQPEKLSPEKEIINYSVVTREKPEIKSPVDGSRFNPIEEAAIVLNPSDLTADTSCGKENWEEILTDIDLEDKFFTSPSKESIGSNSIWSSYSEKYLFLEQQCRESHRISSHSSVLRPDLEETETEIGEFNSYGLSFHDFQSEANNVADHLACSDVSLMHCKLSCHTHGKLAPRCLDYGETSFNSTLEKSLMQLDAEMGRVTLKALIDELEDNNNPQDPLYWPLNPESYWNIEVF
jgi:hypothetical protein